ncbi:hypothetical protein GCM10025868_28410 [Angustibacter aerolatus]|uniref:Peptidase S11 D-alanyl-D-alanine carboxypeptidase A N-terminal domain-containing protein n=1 Tax=Angustibacter aerolatus TaxID=1162965 RepID=A0ABQ6JLB1_9ACTN|nr:D-alanyl-D-alanine carboxypeptidase [Angustibacter aerolatus]GMA87591.1 hypothetical protein GCM10025868_28410 [Angustibacter aerolatus]
MTTVKRAQAPAGSPLLGSVAGDTLGTIVSQMLLTSDNDHAEALNRLVSLRYGTGTTWTRSRIAQRAVLAREGTEIDAGQPVRRQRPVARRPALGAAGSRGSSTRPGPAPSLSLLRGAALPTSGRTGTLQARYGRFDTKPSKCAAGKVHAKTGTLGDAVALAGWTTGTDGRRKAFAFLVNGRGDGLALKRKARHPRRHRHRLLLTRAPTLAELRVVVDRSAIWSTTTRISARLRGRGGRRPRRR